MMVISRSLFCGCACLALLFAACPANAEKYNSTRSNQTSDGADSQNSVEGTGDVTEGDLLISNDKVVRKRPGRTTYGLSDPDWETSQEELLAMLYYEFLLEGASEDEAIEYALIVALIVSPRDAASGLPTGKR